MLITYSIFSNFYYVSIFIKNARPKGSLWNILKQFPEAKILNIGTVEPRKYKHGSYEIPVNTNSILVPFKPFQYT